MKKILIVIDNLRIGGIQKSLVNLLKEIEEKYDITLYLFNFEGEYIKYIPPSVNIMEAPTPLKLLTKSQKESKQMGAGYYLLRAMLAAFTKVINNHIPLRLLFRFQKKIKGYDVTISYMQSHHRKVFAGGCNEFVLQRVNCKKNITFLHCDYLNYGGNNTYSQNIYRKFTNVATVSKSCKERFVEVMPDMECKVKVVRNCHDYISIKKLSERDSIIYDKDYFNVVTIARLSVEKGLTRVIDVIDKLKNDNYKIMWHIIGEGGQHEELAVIIKENRLDNEIVLHGQQINPYKYLKNADLLLVPSIHEAAPMVFDEAKCIGLPILTTDTTSAEEMVASCHAGWVCSNDADAIYNKLKDVMNDINQIQIKKNYLKMIEFNNQVAVMQFNELIDN